MIERKKYLERLIAKKENGLVKVITGIRRCGKSYLLFNIYKGYLKSIGIEDECIICLALDDDENIKYRNPLELGKYIRSLTSDESKTYYVFLDEILSYKKMLNNNFSLPQQHPQEFLRFTMDELQQQQLLEEYNDADTWIFGKEIWGMP